MTGAPNASSEDVGDHREAHRAMSSQRPLPG
jgi:hypothetical protein